MQSVTLVIVSRLQSHLLMGSLDLDIDDGT